MMVIAHLQKLTSNDRRQGLAVLFFAREFFKPSSPSCFPIAQNP